MIVEQKWEDCLAEAAEREFASLEEWCNFLEASLRKAGVEPDPGQAEAALAAMDYSPRDPLAFRECWKHYQKLLPTFCEPPKIVVFGLKDGEESLTCVAGCADALAAPYLEKQLEKACNLHPEQMFIVNLAGMNYVSSSGLRVFMKMFKRVRKIRLADISPESYEIIAMTGMGSIIPMEKAMRRLSIKGSRKISEGANGEVYRVSEDTIIKVYRPELSLEEIRTELETAKAAFTLGLPTALSFDVVRVGDRYGAVYEMLQAKSMGDLIRENPDKLQEYVGQMVGFLKRIHAVEVEEDTPGLGMKHKDMMLKYLHRVASCLPENSSSEIEDWLESLPDSHGVVHGDCHAKNIMVDQQGEFFLIDMDSMGQGQPLFEFAALYASYSTYVKINKDEERQLSITGFSTEMGELVCESLLKAYFEDEAERKTVEVQAKLLSYLRVMSHYFKKGDKAGLEECKAIIAALLPAWRAVKQR